MAKKLKPVHPGEILREEFMKPLGLSMNKLAMDLHVPVTRIAEILISIAPCVKRTLAPPPCLAMLSLIVRCKMTRTSTQSTWLTATTNGG